MGARLEVQSTPGEGALFWFELELAVERRAPEGAPELPKAARALVVDDNAACRRVVRDYLTRWGAECSEFASGAAAIEALAAARREHEAIPYDLALIDYRMPEMNGIQLVRELRHRLGVNGEDLPVILTHEVYDEHQLQSELDELEICCTLTKPVTASQLLDCVAERLGAGKPGCEERSDGGEEDAVALIPPTASLQPVVLIVEDAPTNVTLTKALLSYLLPGAEVLEARDGREAVEIAAERVPDVILMDSHIPGLDGVEAARRIRQNEAETGSSCSAIVALTGDACSEERARCLAAGMDEFLTKPLEGPALRDVLQRLLLGSRGSAEPTRSTVLSDRGCPDTAADEPSFDREGLLQAFNHNPDVYAELVEIALQRVPESIGQAAAGVRDGNTQQVREAAHTLKGVAANMRFCRLEELAEHLSAAAKREDAPAMRELESALRGEWEAVRGSLNGQELPGEEAQREGPRTAGPQSSTTILPRARPLSLC